MATINNLTNTTLATQPANSVKLKSEISDQNKIIKEMESLLRAAILKRNQLYGQEAASRGMEPAYISHVDLQMIIEDLLANKSPASKAFQRHEANKGMCARWAKRTIKYPVDKFKLSSALDALATNTFLMRMKKYKVLDVKDIEKSDSYSAALTKLKKQLGIADTLQDKDNQLINKDSVIADKEAEIIKLKAELLRNKSNDWKPQAVALQQDGISVTEIAKQLSKSRGTVSSYLNSPSVKPQIP